MSCTYAYNNLGDLVSAIYNDGSTPAVAYGYDRRGRISSVLCHGITTTRTYNDADQVVSESYSGGTLSGLSVTNGYDGLLRRNAVGLNGQSSTLSSYGYDNASRLSAVTNGSEAVIYTYLANSSVITNVLFTQFEYVFDEIGNRTQTRTRGNASGTGLRTTTYSTGSYPNYYSGRTVPGEMDVLGSADPGAVVMVNGFGTYRHSDYFQRALAVDNSGGGVNTRVDVEAANGTNAVEVTGYTYVEGQSEGQGSDLDGNQTSSGHCGYKWDGENRLIEVNDGQTTVQMEYDWQGRRIGKKVIRVNESSYLLQLKFLYDSWNLIAELDQNNVLVRGYGWGADLSGSNQGAGGVGGLVILRPGGGTAQFPVYDGNGNVVGYADGNTGANVCSYEYGPFGEVIRATGTMAKTNPFRFSTKYTDNESDLVYYGFRYYNPSTGRWISRDPMEESGGLNLYGFVRNNPVRYFDALGMQPTKDCCCECAVGINIVDVAAKHHYANNFPATFFNIQMFLEYHPSPSGRPGRVTYKWEENTLRPPPEWVARGAKPNQWYDVHVLNPKSYNDNWTNREQSCDPPVGRIVWDYDFPSIDPSLPPRTLHLRFTLINPPNCGCEKESVSVTAVQVGAPNGTDDPSFETPDPTFPR